MTDVLFPVVAADTPEAGGTITAWLVADGDVVTAGQVLCEVSVTKAFGEIESPATGTIRLLCTAEQSVVQGTVIARVER
ncbi:MAG: lipoyl domain-containing protein [Sporichthyaceae bacterium]